MNMKSTLSTLSLLAIFSTNASARAFVPGGNLNLKCTGKTYVKSQPCHGYNTRSMQLAIAAYNLGYSEERTYGGCYPMGDNQDGQLNHFARSNQNPDVITFDLIPADSAQGVMKAQLNLRTLILKLDTRNVQTFYQQPNLLNCVINR